MADYIGTIQSNCQSDTLHLGMGSCDKKEGKTVALLITALNSRYSLEAETFVNELEEHIVSDGLDRLTVLSGIKGNTPSGGEPNTVDDGTYGEQVTIGVTGKTFVFDVDGGDCRFKELSRLNGKTMRAFRIDDANYVYGTAKKDGDNAYFTGFKASFYTYKVHPDGSNQYMIKVSVSFSSDNENEERNMAAFSIGSVPYGLQSVTLKPGATAGTAQVVTACGGEDITAEYGEDWKANMFVNSTGAIATTATFDEDTGLLTIAPAGTYRIASAKVLAAGNILGYEGTNTGVEIKTA